MVRRLARALTSSAAALALVAWAAVAVAQAPAPPGVDPAADPSADPAADPSADPFVTPGLPWTYVPAGEVPTYAIDTAYERHIRDVYAGFGDPDRYEILYLFRIRCHPHLAEVDSAGRLRVEVPRDPGVAEVLTLAGASVRVDSAQYGQYPRYPTGYTVGGFRCAECDDRPELRFAELALSEIDRTARPVDPSQDTSYTGDMKFAPDYYEIYPAPPGSDRDAWAYFVQFVDSVWHPRVSAVPTGRDAFADARAYPCPARAGGTLTVELPASWASAPVTLRVYAPSGALVAREVRAAARRHELRVGPGWPPGAYSVAVYRDGGRYGVLQFVVGSAP